MPSRQSNTINPTCPNCQSELQKEWLRPIDRFFTIFVRVQRYRCDADWCHWQGNLKTQSLLTHPVRAENHKHAVLQGATKI